MEEHYRNKVDALDKRVSLLEKAIVDLPENITLAFKLALSETMKENEKEKATVNARVTKLETVVNGVVKVALIFATAAIGLYLSALWTNIINH